MRLHILAVGQGRGTPEGVLVEDYLGRARASGKRLGFTAVTIEEVAVSKLREARARIAEEGESGCGPQFLRARMSFCSMRAARA